MKLHIARAVIAPEAATLRVMGIVDRSDSLSKITSYEATVLAALPMPLFRGVCACNTVYSIFKVQGLEKTPFTYRVVDFLN